MMLNGLEYMNNIYPTGIIYEDLSAVAPMYGAATMEADSSLTYAQLPVASRKRLREDSNNRININQLLSYQTNIGAGSNRSSAGQFTFLGQDFSSQIQRQQLQVDSYIAQHTEKVRLEMEERRKMYSRRVMAAVEEGIMKKLEAKEDEIQKMMKLNWKLEERVKSLANENEIWRDLAQTNEATANALRSNLEQLLVQVEDNRRHIAAEVVEDAQSYCGSNVYEEVESAGNNRGEGSFRLCRGCGKDEACVLLLPCRHLCFCSVCGSSQNICPICKSTKNCSLHVNLTT